MRKFTQPVLLGLALTLTGFPAAFSADEAEDEQKYIEEVIVTAERGETNVMDRAMTVTGFNAILIDKLGIQNTDDIEVLTPGLQVGNRSQGSAPGLVGNENDHFFMRGLGTERSANLFPDTSVAIYVDGVYTDQTFGIDGGMFDVERVEVARGPQGTTGGKNAIAGSINFYTRKPTDTFDMRATVEINDISTQRLQLAFGGPIGNSDFSYRLGLSSYTGDGRIKNFSGPDAMEPNERIFTPQLRWKNDRWDITARYSHMEDTGTPNSSLPLTAENTVDEFILANGERLCAFNPDSGMEECQRNPFFGVQPAPAVAGCSNISQDGSRNPNQYICDADELRWEVAFNAPIAKDSTAENFSIDVLYAINDNLTLNYKFGWHDVWENTRNDVDQRNRVGGGVCPFTHPSVIAGVLQAGQTSRICALDGGGNGTFTDQLSDHVFSSEQTSHEITLVSDFDGPFNFTLGANTIENEEPYMNRLFDRGWTTGGEWLFSDTSAACNANIESMFGTGGSMSGGDSWLLKDLHTDPATMANAESTFNFVVACPGSPELLGYPHANTGDFYAANLDGQVNGYLGSAIQEATGIYFNVEYEYNDQWTLFAGIRRTDDDKDRSQEAASGVRAFEIADPSVRCDMATGGGVDLCEDGFGVVTLALAGSDIANKRPKAELNWSETTWNAGVQFRPGDQNVMYYGRVSTGYRAGGSFPFRTEHPGPWQYPAEELINYEVGVKGLYFDNKVQLSATYFLQDFDKHWVFATRLRTAAEQEADPDGGPTTGEINAIGGSEIAGAEVEGAWRITDRVTLRGFYNYLDSDIGAYPSILSYVGPGVTGTWVRLPWTDSDGNARTNWIFGSDEPTELAGKQLPNSPRHKTSLTLSYDVPVPADWGELEVLTIANIRGKKFVEIANYDGYQVDAYTRWDIRANWRSADSQWRVTAYVQNLLDEAALHMWKPIGSVGGVFGTVVEPREFGISVSWENL